MVKKEHKDDQIVKTPVDEPVVIETEFKLIPLDLIDDPEQPMRTDISPASVEDLVVSIKQVGIIEPLVVKSVKDRYEVIAGHRRLYSCRLAKIPEAPCYIKKANGEQTEMLKIHENLYRADVRPSDEAQHFSNLIRRNKMTPVQIAKLISRNIAYVTDRLDILDYPDFLLAAMNSGEITFSVAREFAKFDDIKQMRSAVYYAKRGGMTYEMARKWVQDFKRSKEQPEVTSTTVINPVNGAQEIEHTGLCVYCREGVKLIEAEVVYMHSDCLRQANNQVIEDPQNQPTQ